MGATCGFATARSIYNPHRKKLQRQALTTKSAHSQGAVSVARRLLFVRVMTTSVYAFVDDPRRAHDIVHELKGIGFPITEISVVMPGRSAQRERRPDEPADDARNGATVAGVATGGVLGGVVGWLVGAGALTLPGVGPLVAAGPALAALTGAAAGAAAGGLAGGLAILGLSEADADRSARELRSGRILISVATRGDDARSSVESVFDKHGARDGGVTADRFAAKEA